MSLTLPQRMNLRDRRKTDPAFFGLWATFKCNIIPILFVTNDSKEELHKDFLADVFFESIQGVPIECLTDEEIFEKDMWTNHKATSSRYYVHINGERKVKRG
jgi:hypothetical protein